MLLQTQAPLSWLQRQLRRACSLTCPRLVAQDLSAVAKSNLHSANTVLVAFPIVFLRQAKTTKPFLAFAQAQAWSPAGWRWGLRDPTGKVTGF